MGNLLMFNRRGHATKFLWLKTDHFIQTSTTVILVERHSWEQRITLRAAKKNISVFNAREARNRILKRKGSAYTLSISTRNNDTLKSCQLNIQTSGSSNINNMYLWENTAQILLEQTCISFHFHTCSAALPSWMSEIKIPWPTSACLPSIIMIPRPWAPCNHVEQRVTLTTYSYNYPVVSEIKAEAILVTTRKKMQCFWSFAAFHMYTRC